MTRHMLNTDNGQETAVFSQLDDWFDSKELVILPAIMEQPKMWQKVTKAFQWRRQWNSFLSGLINGATAIRFD